MIQKKNKFSFYLIVGILILCFPFIINALENKELLSFWGSYLSGIATFVSVYVMYRMNEKIMLNQRKETIYNHDKKSLEELKIILVQVLEAFDISIFNKFANLGNRIDSKEQKLIFIAAKEKLLKTQVAFELLTEINLSKESFDDEKSALIIEELRELYYRMNISYFKLLHEFMAFVNELQYPSEITKIEVFKKIADKNNKEIPEIQELYPILKIKFKEYLLHKEKLMNEKFRG
ncbi:hypothetical protein [Cetobacterium sp.]|uniref:hypothetical protein n=1 Tax=Cetobacterium sp. TaxID=2071632 RepID=UPI003EE57010